jgi:uncharacterized DUF497 family protein
MRFEWDEDKNEQNFDDHGLTFEEARLIWQRPDDLFIEEDDRGYDEDRYWAFGLLPDGTLLIVSHTHRGENIRLISARKMTPQERKGYYAKIHRPKW